MNYHSVREFINIFVTPYSCPINNLTVKINILPNTQCYYRGSTNKIYTIKTVEQHELYVQSGTEVKFEDCDLTYHILDKKYESGDIPKIENISEFASILKKGTLVKHESNLITQLVEDLDVIVDRNCKILVEIGTPMREIWPDPKIDSKNCFNLTRGVEAKIIWPNLIKETFVQMNKFMNMAL